MTSQSVEKFLRDCSNTIEDLTVAEGFQQLEGYYVNKLWNQLSDLSIQLVNNPNFIEIINLDEFYENFIKDFEHRIQPLKLIELIIPIAEKKFQKDRKAAFDFLEKFGKTVKQDNKALVRLMVGQIQLRLEDKQQTVSSLQCKDLQLVRKLIEEAENNLDRLIEVGPVHAAFYKVSAIYQRQNGDFARYYTEALRYLGCEDLKKLSAEEQQEHALLLCVAALLGKGVYNFGELLAHPILNALEGSQKSWFIDVLKSLNSGDWDAFQAYKLKLEAESIDIKGNMQSVEEKLRLLSLMEMAVKTPQKHRNISFEKIAKYARLDEDLVELLVMKAIANGLVQGSIDQVNRVVNITWVQPRVLSTAQVLNLAGRMNEWRADVSQIGAHMEHYAKEIIMSFT